MNLNNIKAILRRILDRILSSRVLNDSTWIDSSDAKYVALALAGLSLLISATHIVRHLKNYSMPQVQVYVVRILFTCPVYALTSSLALVLGEYGTYAEVIRDVYEPFVIYSFLNLILEYAGGESDCVYMIENESPLRMPCPLCLMKPQPRDARLMRFCQKGVLQFIVTKPIVAVLDVIMLAVGLYLNYIFQMVEIVVYNISYGWALYCLFVFYLATAPVIHDFKPIAKFSTVKAIIFATYYQSMILKLSLSEPAQAIKWNDFLLCAEMVLFSLLLMIAFPVREFMGGIPDRRVLENVKEVFTVRDVLQDVYHNFNPAYRDYSLQRSQTEMAGSVEYFPRNKKMNAVALQMTERYRGRSKRLAFNSLLRGTRPVKAGLRRYHRDDLEEGGGAGAAPLGEQEEGDEEDEEEEEEGEGDSDEGDGRIHDAPEGVLSGDETDTEHTDLVERRRRPARHHRRHEQGQGSSGSSSSAAVGVSLGRLTLATKKKPARSPFLGEPAHSPPSGSHPSPALTISKSPLPPGVQSTADEEQGGQTTFSPLVRSPSSISDEGVLTSPHSPAPLLEASKTAGTVSPAKRQASIAAAASSPDPRKQETDEAVLLSPSNDWTDFVEG